MFKKYPHRAHSGSWYCSDRSETETDQQNRKKYQKQQKEEKFEKEEEKFVKETLKKFLI